MAMTPRVKFRRMGRRTRGISLLVTVEEYAQIERDRRSYENLSDALRRIIFDALSTANTPEKLSENSQPPVHA